MFTLYKKDLAASKFETLLILGFIVVGNLFLYCKAKTSWPLDMSMTFSTLFLGFVPLFIFFRAFSFIRDEWKENTVYFMMSLPTTGNTIFISKLLALLTQFFILGIVAATFIAVFISMQPGPHQIWVTMKGVDNIQHIVWELGKIGIIVFLIFGMAIIIAFFSAVVGKLFKRFSGLITFVVFIITNYVTGKFLSILIELTNKIGFNYYIEKKVMIGDTALTWQSMPNLDFLFVIIIIFITAVSVLLFLATTTIYDRKVEL